MALKTRGKLIALGLVTFASAAALTAGGVALADDNARQQQPVLRIITTDSSGGTRLQNVRPSPDSRDCPFGHHRAPAGEGTDNAGGDV